MLSSSGAHQKGGVGTGRSCVDAQSHAACGELLLRVVELPSFNKRLCPCVQRECILLTDTAAGCISLAHMLGRGLVPAGV